jgi:hypothetical protein
MLKWEEIKSHDGLHFVSVYRAKVPGGWLVRIMQCDGSGLTFYPDPEHEWDGSSLP